MSTARARRDYSFGEVARRTTIRTRRLIGAPHTIYSVMVDGSLAHEKLGPYTHAELADVVRGVDMPPPVKIHQSDPRWKVPESKALSKPGRKPKHAQPSSNEESYE